MYFQQKFHEKTQWQSFIKLNANSKMLFDSSKFSLPFDFLIVESAYHGDSSLHPMLLWFVRRHLHRYDVVRGVACCRQSSGSGQGLVDRANVNTSLRLKSANDDSNRVLKFNKRSQGRRLLRRISCFVWLKWYRRRVCNDCRTQWHLKRHKLRALRNRQACKRLWKNEA